MKRNVRVILLDEADSEYKRLNDVIGQQIKEGKENTEEMPLLMNWQRNLIQLSIAIFGNKETMAYIQLVVECGRMRLKRS